MKKPLSFLQIDNPMKKITLLIICLLFLFIQRGNCSITDTLFVSVYGNITGPNECNETAYYINGEVQDYCVWGLTPSIHIAIIDSISCDPVNNCNKDFGQFNIFNDPNGDCISDIQTFYTTRNRPENYFIYRDNEPSAIQAMAQLLDSIGDGHIIIAYSAFSYTYSLMDPAFKNIFQSLGSALIPTMPDTVPFIFICRKGDPGSIHEIIGTQANSYITMTMTYQCSPTGISDLESTAIHIYPNPVQDKLHIDFKNEDFRDGEIKIYDAMGNLISTQKHFEGELTINTEKFSTGIYFISAESQNHISTLKFCKTE